MGKSNVVGKVKFMLLDDVNKVAKNHQVENRKTTLVKVMFYKFS